VDFVPGRISVKAYNKGKCVAKAENRTTGKPVAIKICPVSTQIKNDGHDTAILNFCVVDAKGRIVPTATNHLKFEVISDGIMRGVGNGDPNSHESDILPERNLFAGWCQMLVMSKLNAQNIKVIATGDGLESAEIELDVLNVEQPNCILGAKNCDVTGFTCSEVTTERPDPLVILSDDNMNSFLPVGFLDAMYQLDYYSGWRTYRAFIDIPEDGTYELHLPKVYADELEIYVDGQKYYTAMAAKHHGSATCLIEGKAGEKKELRILFYVKNAEAIGGGIAEAVRLYKM
jgi:beta-galactosidase